MLDKKTNQQIFLAAKKDKVEKLVELLNQFDSPDILDEEDTSTSLLSWAAYNGSSKCVEYLITQGANVNGVGAEDSPIASAAINDKPKAFELLLNAGAKLDIKEYTSIYLLELAIKQNRLDWLKTLFANDYLRQEHGNDTDLLKLVHDEGVLAYLLSLGLDMHQVYEYEFSPFVYVARMDDVEQFELFLRHADVEKVKGEEGYIAFMESNIYKNSDITHMLIAAGAPLKPMSSFENNEYADDDETPLMTACRYGHVDLAKKMMLNGADITRQSEEGYTSLIAAVRGNCEALITDLIEHGVDINSEWQDGTALDVAKAKELFSVVTLLENAGAKATGNIPEEIEDEIWRANNAKHELPDGYLTSLVSQLKACIPVLDAQKMLDDISTYFEAEGYDEVETKYIVLEWLSDCLEEQNLMVYEEWKEYFGELPDLKMIEPLGIDESYDPEPLLDMIEHTNIMWPHQVPYVEYMNHFLKPHGLMIVSFAFENLYMMCVKDDEQALSKLDKLLAEFDIHMAHHDAMTLDDCLKMMKSLPRTLGDRVISHRMLIYRLVSMLIGIRRFVARFKK